MQGPARRRNVAVVGPHHSGKTTLVEALLAGSGAIARRGSVSDGTATTDYEPECIDRGGSTAVGFAELHTNEIDLTLIDCPGFVDFAQETKLALLAADAAIVVIDAVPARVALTRPLVEYLDARRMPHGFFINKLDRPGSDFQGTLDELVAAFGKRIVAEHLPIGEAESYRGYVDLAGNHAYLSERGGTREVSLSEAHLDGPAAAARAHLLETLGDRDDHLLEELLEGIEPPLDEVRRDLHDQTCTDDIVPVLAGAGLTDIGVAANALLAVVAEQFPAPSGDPNAPLVAQVCKTFVNPQAGKLSVVRIFEGTLGADATLTVAGSGTQLRSGGLYRLQGKKQEAIASAGPGEIVAVARLDGVRTGDTLTATQTKPRALPELEEPLFAVAIAPKEKLDEAKLSAVLQRVLEEDPALRLQRAEFTGELQLLGMGDVHVATTVQRIARKYKLALETKAPAIAYRETVSASTEVRGRYKHQTGGHGQFGDVLLRIEPRERGTGVTFSETIVGGVVPKTFFPAIEKGVREALNRGPLAGYPVVDVHVTLIDGSYHSVDSSEASFRTAAGMAIRDGLAKCAPQVLEPVDRLEALVPEGCVSSVLGGLTAKRGTILSFEPAQRRGFQRVTALVPQAELGNYITELRTCTQGMGSYRRAHERFEVAPQKVKAGNFT